MTALVLLPAAATAFLAFRSGGYFPGPPALVAAELLIVLALWVAVSRRPFAGWSPGLLVAAGALAGLGAWMLLSR